MEIDNFKAFVRTIPSIKDDVVNGRYTWQQLYELYVMYGENDKMWAPYKKSTTDLSGILEIVKNVDLDALSKSFDGIQKVLDLVGGLSGKDNSKQPTSRQWYDD
ncbi:MAG: spore coat protein YlbD [Coprobacillus sp.]